MTAGWEWTKQRQGRRWVMIKDAEEELGLGMVDVHEREGLED